MTSFFDVEKCRDAIVKAFRGQVGFGAYALHVVAQIDAKAWYGLPHLDTNGAREGGKTHAGR
jgi:hypothetical protein